ncbi:MAG: DUF748 domain-containing protein [Candidatus Brocadiaceae bacterium]|nr:DUF748 domain-containing protein [Candidatus Brocadiaceae bacterium]
MKFPKSLKELCLYQKMIFWAIIFFSSYTIIGFFILPPIIKSVFQKKLTAALNRTVTIKNIKLNPYALSLTVNEFSVSEPEGQKQFLSFHTLYVNLQSVSIFKCAPVFKRITLDSPHANIVFNEDGRFHCSDILESFGKDFSMEKEDKEDPFEFAAHTIQIVNGGAVVVDNLYQATHRIEDVDISIPFLSNFERYVDQYASLDISFVFNTALISLQGQIKPFSDSLETHVDFSAQGIALAHYSNYSRKAGNLTIESGKVDVALDMYYHALHDGKPRLSAPGKIVVEDFVTFDEENQPFLKTTLSEITIEDSNVLEWDFYLASVYFKSNEKGLTRRSDKSLVIKSLISQFTPEAAQKKPKPEPPFRLRIDEILVEDTTVFLTDFVAVDDNEFPNKIDFLRMSTLSVKDLFIDLKKREIAIGEVGAEHGSFFIQSCKNGDLNIQPFIDFSIADDDAAAIKNKEEWN